jgi:hypothetical protein
MSLSTHRFSIRGSDQDQLQPALRDQLRVRKDDFYSVPERFMFRRRHLLPAAIWLAAVPSDRLPQTRLGVETIDVGIRQLGMHSIRELCGMSDAYGLCRILDPFGGFLMSETISPAELKALIDQTYKVEEEYVALRQSYEYLQSTIEQVIEFLPNAIWIVERTDQFFCKILKAKLQENFSRRSVWMKKIMR